jgi:hypothetical protein
VSFLRPLKLMTVEELMKTRMQDHRTRTRRHSVILLNLQHHRHDGAQQMVAATSISALETQSNWPTL